MYRRPNHVASAVSVPSVRWAVTTWTFRRHVFWTPMNVTRTFADARLPSSWDQMSRRDFMSRRSS